MVILLQAVESWVWAWELRLLARCSNGAKLRDPLYSSMLCVYYSKMELPWSMFDDSWRTVLHNTGNTNMYSRIEVHGTPLCFCHFLLPSTFSLLLISSFHYIYYSALCSGIPVFSLETTLGLQNIIMNCTVSS